MNDRDGYTPVWVLTRGGQVALSRRRRRPVMMRAHSRPGSDWMRLPWNLEVMHHDIDGMDAQGLLLPDDERGLREDLERLVSEWVSSGGTR